MPQPQTASPGSSPFCVYPTSVFSVGFTGVKNHMFQPGPFYVHQPKQCTIFVEGCPSKFLCIFNVKFDPQKIWSHLMNSITPIYGNSLEHNHIFPASLFPEPPPQKKLQGPLQPTNPNAVTNSPKGRPFHPHHEALGLCVRSWKNSGRAIASLRTLKTSGT